MNYYERIQRSVDYIESRLEEEIEIEKAAGYAYMSYSSYYRLFFALTGHGVKEYIRQRRISKAVEEIRKSGRSILEIALQYGFESNEAFTRACRRVTGYPPSAFKKYDLHYVFERMNLLDRYFEVQDAALMEKYPEIKILKELEPFRVAYYCYYGCEPEGGAFSVMSDWLKRSGLSIEKDNLRLFGFNNPSPSRPDEREYGYEVIVTVGDDEVVNDSLVKTKTMPGGLYAVCGVRYSEDRDKGTAINEAWRRFSMWLKESKYTYGEHQWLEEHLQFNDEFEHTGGMDLYMPIKLKKPMEQP